MPKTLVELKEERQTKRRELAAIMDGIRAAGGDVTASAIPHLTGDQRARQEEIRRRVIEGEALSDYADAGIAAAKEAKEQGRAEAEAELKERENHAQRVAGLPSARQVGALAASSDGNPSVVGAPVAYAISGRSLWSRGNS